MLNVAKLSQALGTRVLVRFGNVSVWAVVRDVRKAWSRVDLLVSPESGEGEEWVSMERVVRADSALLLK